MKICTKCSEEKNLSEFYKDKGQKSRLRPDCIDCVKLIQKLYYEKNKDKKKIYQNKNKDKIKRYRLKNKKRQKRQRKDWEIKNIERRKTYHTKYNKSHRKEKALYSKVRKTMDIHFKLKCNLRTRVYKALKGHDKSLSTMFLIGCDIDYLMYHLQEQFVGGMSWDNYGDWHVDHRLPCASFDLSKESEQRACFHYTNLQPLWAKENLKKG